MLLESTIFNVVFICLSDANRQVYTDYVKSNVVLNSCYAAHLNGTQTVRQAVHLLDEMIDLLKCVMSSSDYKDILDVYATVVQADEYSKRLTA